MAHIIMGDISKMSPRDHLDMQDQIRDERELQRREIIALERIATALERTSKLHQGVCCSAKP